ncbi:glycosyl hydrolase family 28-related protein [Bacteroides sp. 214]|uniref:glycosyl hydrolase family 28-related protein n=1 Tax=Bacteroides sp. 214 TaxID=2302935 RepID=UPI0013D6E025|nr:glycosyl hydrolase family 28-related protein [Bacteroides sp. 214]
MNNCGIDAPLYQIFNDTANIDIHAKIDKAYPQWFGAKGDYENDDTKAIQICCSKFKHVHIPKGKYKVTSTIKIPPGVSISGDCGTYEEFTLEDGIVRKDYMGTKIYPVQTAGEYFIDNFVFHINQKENTTNEVFYPFFPHNGEIKNLIIAGFGMNVCNGFKVGYSVKFENIFFADISQALLKNNSLYIDSFHIEKCSFTQKVNATVPVVDCGFLGDGFLMRGCHTFGTVRFFCCNGGAIEGNIQGSFEFHNCRGMKMFGGHLEVGNVLIESSNISIEDMFMWQNGGEENPPILNIYTSGSNNTSVVLKNISFLYYINGDQHGLPDNNDKSPIDIKIDSMTTLSIEKCYKVYCHSGNIGDNQLMGLTIMKEDNTLFDNFNNYSSYFSDSCHITTNYRINSSKRIETPRDATIYIMNTKDFTGNPFYPWHGNETKTYYYKALVMWDCKRKILGAIPNEYVRTAGKVGCIYCVSAYMGRNHSARIFRGEYSGSYTEFCDIHYAGAYFIVDDGISCGGGAFKWRPISELGSQATMDGTRADYIEYNGENIVVTSFTAMNRPPNYGEWKRGDKIIVYSASTSTKTEYCCVQSGAPGNWMQID